MNDALDVGPRLPLLILLKTSSNLSNTIDPCDCATTGSVDRCDESVEDEDSDRTWKESREDMGSGVVDVKSGGEGMGSL